MILLQVKSTFSLDVDSYIFKNKEAAASFMEKLWSNAVSSAVLSNSGEADSSTEIRIPENILKTHTFLGKDFSKITWKRGKKVENMKFILCPVNNYLAYEIEETLVAGYQQEHFFGGSSYHVIYRLANGKYRNYYDGKEIVEVKDNYLKYYIGTAGNYDSFIQAEKMLLKHRPESQLCYKGGIYYDV